MVSIILVILYAGFILGMGYLIVKKENITFKD